MLVKFTPEQRAVYAEGLSLCAAPYMDLAQLEAVYAEAAAALADAEQSIKPVEDIFRDLTPESATQRGFHVVEHLMMQNAETGEMVIKRFYTEQALAEGTKVRARVDHLDPKTRALTQHCYYAAVGVTANKDIIFEGPRCLHKHLGTPSEHRMFKHSTEAAKDVAFFLQLYPNGFRRLCKYMKKGITDDSAFNINFYFDPAKEEGTFDIFCFSGAEERKNTGYHQQLRMMYTTGGRCQSIYFVTMKKGGLEKAEDRPSFYIAPDSVFGFRHGDGHGFMRSKPADYEGQLNIDFAPHGQGVLKTHNDMFGNITIQGVYQKGSIHYGKITNEEQDSVYEGQIRELVAHGQGKLTIRGQVSQGQFDMGVFVDPSQSHKPKTEKITTPDFVMVGEKSADGSFMIGVMTYPRSFQPERYKLRNVPEDVKVVFKRTGKFHTSNTLQFGEGLYEDHRGIRYEGHFERGQWNGLGKVTYPDGRVYEGEFTDSHLQGRGKYTMKDGMVYEGPFKNTLAHGVGSVTPPGKKTRKVEFNEENFVRFVDDDDDHRGGGGNTPPQAPPNQKSGGASRFVPPGSTINKFAFSAFGFRPAWFPRRFSTPLPATLPRGLMALRLLAKLK